MAIDLGSDSMKIAVVLPKVPMEVALDGRAQRKTPVAVGFRDGERLFGADAINVASMRPAYVYQSISSIIGKHIDHPTVQLYRQRYPYHNLTYDELTGQLIFHHPEGMSFTVEELLAMLLEYARDIAESHSEATIKTCVLTVPSFYGLNERESLIRAVRIAGLELQQLINVNTAVALDFGISRRKSFNESSQFFMFFDVGYTSTTATVVSYHVGKHHQGGVSAQDPILTILGVGSAPNLGTSSLIYRIRDYFAESFSESTAIPLSIVRENARVMSRISREAVRVLNVLSANTEADAQIEQLLNEKDFRLHITREQMETLCKMEFDAFAKPFSDALTGSGVDLSVIQDIVLMGGGTRIPKVQEILMSLGKRYGSFASCYFMCF
ncbi:unnamed protein product [Echinostoma caproni]|uniref:Hypoxia up-regulated protein 1 n=1 Tax=Echinostoma caproni TaxID=27848 RepID=A0A183AIC2_9TREM|nr:unnamed protein product [Echinostoma caproni]